jgi:hypothetical protein
MFIDDFIDILNNVAGNLENGWEHEAFKDGIIVKTSVGDYYVDIVNGKLEHQRLEYLLKMPEGVRPIELNLRGQPFDLPFPLRIKYSTIGFMGALSGSAGYLIIFRDGRFLSMPLIVS